MSGDSGAAGLEQRLQKVEELLPRGLEGDEEAIHDLRVSLRRVRVLGRELMAGAGRVAGPLAELRAGAQGFFRALGTVRDLDILKAELTQLADSQRLESGVDPRIIRWIELERMRVRTGLPSAASFFVDEVERFRSTGGIAAVIAAGNGRQSAGVRSRRRQARRLHEDLNRLAGDGGRPSGGPADQGGESFPAEALHRLRIRAKKLRYAIEGFFRSADPERANRLESGLKKLQDALGAIQDAAATVVRLDELAATGVLPPEAAGPARVALANERARRTSQFLDELGTGGYANLLHEVRNVAAKQADGASGGGKNPERVPLEQIPGIGAAKARRLAEAGLASSDALKSASLEDLASVKTIGPHQARLIKEYVAGNADGSARGDQDEPDGKRFERIQSVLGLGATVSDYARTLAEELARDEEGDAIRAGRQAERLVDRLSDLSDRVEEIPTKKLKGLRGELREAEGLLAKVLDLDASTLKMNKLRKALKAHRKAMEAYLA